MITKQPLPKSKAELSLAANREADQRAKQMADLITVCQSSAERVIALTDMVADLQERVEALEAR